MKNYFESLKGNYEFLEKRPKKADVLENAKIKGITRILSESYNRAITIETETEVFLQSYDTIVCSIEKATGKIRKFWNDYSNTTIKHINTFTGKNFNKKEWLALKTDQL